MAKKTPNNSARTKTADRASKSIAVVPAPATTYPPTWYSAWKSIDTYAPWHGGNPTTAELFRMYVNEAKACFYELFRDHVELYYDGTGWPADPANWEPMFQERDALFVADEQPQAGEQPGRRYGRTYGDERSHTDRLTEKVELRPLRTVNDAYRVHSDWWTGYKNRLQEVLIHRNYAEVVIEELRSAFKDIGTFNVGAGEGKAVMDRLRNDEQGRKAIDTWEQNRDTFQKGIDTLLNEHVGIGRDFTHLLHTALFAFANELRKDPPWDIMDFTPRADGHAKTYAMADTFGTMPYKVYNDASIDPNGGETHFEFERWVPLYLERVGVIADRWKGKGEQVEVETRLRSLAKEVQDKATALLVGDGTAEAKTKAEVAIRQVVEGIAKMNGGVPDALPMERLEWRSSTAAFVYIFNTLAERGYLDIPRKGGKEGERNLAAFARALLQAFDVKGGGGKSLTPEQLRVRLSSGSPGQLADTKRAKIQIPQSSELVIPDVGEME